MSTIRDCYGANGDAPAVSGRNLQLVQKNGQSYLPNGFVLESINQIAGHHCSVGGGYQCEPGSQITRSQYGCGCEWWDYACIAGDMGGPGYQGTYCSTDGKVADFGGHEACMRQS